MIIITNEDSSDRDNKNEDDDELNKWADECVTYNQWNFEDCSGINMDALLDWNS